MIVASLAVAGAFGALVRFVVDSYVGSRLSNTSFPFATVGINVTGSLLLGFVAGLVVLHDGSTDLQAIIGTGFCGGYTTFGTAGVESVRLVRAGRPWLALASTVGTLTLSVGACAAGFAAAGLL